MKEANKTRGILLSLVAIPAAIILWVIIWNMGYIASLVAFALAYAVVWLYEKGAGAKPDKTVALPLILIILVGSFLSFMGGMASDAWTYFHSSEYVSEMGEPTTSEAIDLTMQGLSNGEMWGAYSNDLIMTAVFTLIGAGGVAYMLFKGESVIKPKEDKTTPAAE